MQYDTVARRVGSISERVCETWNNILYIFRPLHCDILLQKIIEDTRSFYCNAILNITERGIFKFDVKFHSLITAPYKRNCFCAVSLSHVTNQSRVCFEDSLLLAFIPLNDSLCII